MATQLQHATYSEDWLLDVILQSGLEAHVQAGVRCGASLHAKGLAGPGMIESI